ncbi:MAG: GntR family transcriptional regulator [Firmicutes bacterium]|nr:GntR family transcriptional regulator [Bacillota bacterium]
MINLDILINDNKEKKTIAQQMEEDLKIDILMGRRRRGSRIIEQELCHTYGISRTPVRDILRRVEKEGLIEIVPYCGACVRGFTPQEIDDFFTMKSILEVQCVRWAISRITKEEFGVLEEIFEFMEFYTMNNDLEKMIRINQGFDAAIYDAAHNKELEETLQRYNFYLRHANAQVPYPLNYLSTVLEEHRAIFRAFLDRDVEAGAQATEIHMMKTMIRRR